MLTEELKKKELYTAICAYGEDLIPGNEYKGLFVCNEYSGAKINDNILEASSIHCIAKLNNNEVLLSTSDREYFVVLRNGHAAFNGTVYAIDAVIAAIFDRQVDIDGILHEMPFPTEEYIRSQIESIKVDKCGMITAMSRRHTKSYLELILQGLMLEKEQTKEKSSQ